MSNEQPEALRLADAIKNSIRPEASLPLGDWARAAAELRRLHEVNQELVEVLEYVRDVLGPHHGWADDSKLMIESAIAKARGGV